MSSLKQPKRGEHAANGHDISEIYRSLRLIRRTEERIAEIYPSDKIRSPVHLSIGQESVAVGVCGVLREDDAVAGTYRGHAMYLAKGGDLDAMMAELYGKATGCSGGKGGSMHLAWMDKGVLGTSAIVGSTISVAVGYALALKREGKGRAVAVFMGDGATEEGAFYESLNFAALHKLPCFLCAKTTALRFTLLSLSAGPPTRSASGSQASASPPADRGWQCLRDPRDGSGGTVAATRRRRAFLYGMPDLSLDRTCWTAGGLRSGAPLAGASSAMARQ